LIVLFGEDVATILTGQKVSSTNTNISGLNNVENGYMYLHPSTTFAPTEYNEQSNTFVTYNG
jgi:hypothetical protein